MDDFAGRVAVVTGGASGIGRATATALVAAGAQVVIADIEEVRVQATAAEIGAVGLHVDVSQEESVRTLAEAVRDRFGTVHILFNNAGIGPLAKIEDLTLNDWQWMLGVNLWGVIYGIHHVLPMMIANGEPCHIVSTASLAGLSTSSMFGAYSVSKYGVVALSEALADEMAQDHPQIGVSVLCPGPVRTDLEQSTRNRPDGLAGALADVPLSHDKARAAAGIPWIEPEDAAAVVLDAIRNRRLYAITHPALFGRLQNRLHRLEAAFRPDAAA